MAEEKIIPAYMKVKEQSNNIDDKKNKSSKKIRVNRVKLIIFLVVGLIILSALIYGISYLIRVIVYSQYNPYSNQIERYGLAKMYDNQKATSHESVTKTEALKLIISSINHLININPTEVEEEFKNQTWVDYAVSKKIVEADEINNSNANSQVTYIEFVTYYVNAISKLRGDKLDTSIYPNFTDIDGIKNEQLYAISDLLVKDVLENDATNLNPNRKLYKGELNKIACDIIKAYNLVVPKGKKFNINEEKEPSNKDIYPYILFDVDKEAYEKDLIIKNQEKAENPNETFIKNRTGLETTYQRVEKYYNTILNIDYETIDENTFKNKLDECTTFKEHIQTISEYVDYVRKNKIKISGKATAQLPIYYYDGLYHRMRVKVEFEILNSDTTKNIIYGDFSEESNDVNYSGKKYTFYIDAVVEGSSIDSVFLYVWDKPLYDIKTDENIVGISLTEKEVKDSESTKEEESVNETSTQEETKNVVTKVVDKPAEATIVTPNNNKQEIGIW